MPISKLNTQILFPSLPQCKRTSFSQSLECSMPSSIVDLRRLNVAIKMLARSSEWHSKGTSKCRYIFFKHVTGWAGSLNTITLLKFRKQALKMQKAYKLYFSANLQLVIGKDSNNKKKKSFVSSAPPPHPKLKWRKNQNKTKTRELHMTLGSFSNPLLPIKNLKKYIKESLKRKTKVILLCLHCSSRLEWASV